MASGLIAALFLLNKVAIRALGRLTLLRNRELTVVLAVVAGLGAAWASHYVGISPALGSFVAGMLLGSSEFATQVRSDIAPLRVVLLTLFFGAAGMVADPVWILRNWYLVGSVVILLTIGKLTITWLIFSLFGQNMRIAAATGLCLAQVGEFAFVLGSIGRTSGVVSEQTYALVVSAAIVSFFFSAFLVPLAPKFGDLVSRILRVQQSIGDDQSHQDPAPEVALIGFGPAGQIAAHPLMERKVRLVVIDLNQKNVRAARRLGFHGEVGDATQNDVLEHARLFECKAIIIAVSDHRSALMILEQVRRAAPHVYTIVRSRYETHAANYTAAGAHVVAGDEHQVGSQLALLLNQWLDREGSQQISTDS